MLTRRETERLIALLERAQRAAEEHAIEQAWHADAMHAVRAPLIENYHRNRHADALDTIASIRRAASTLRGRLDADATTTRRRPRAS